MQFIFVDTMDEVLEHALEPRQQEETQPLRAGAL
jgi:hypothetical protein